MSKVAIAIALIACGFLGPALATSPPLPPSLRIEAVKVETPRKPDYRLSAFPFTLSSWDSNGWAVEAKVSGLVRVEGRRLILTFGDPLLIRRTDPKQKNPPSMITSVQVLLAVDGPTHFSILASSAKVKVGKPLPAGREPLEVEMPEEMTIELDEDPRGPLSPGLANAFLKVAVIMPGRDDKGVAHEEWGHCYSDGGRTMFSDRLVEGGHKVVEDPNRRTGVYTPFELAASEGRTELIEPMLQAGALRDAIGDHGFTPLMLAVHSNHPATVAALLRSGVDPNRKAPNRKDPFWDGQSALMYAVRPEQVEVRRLLEAAGANPTLSMPNGFTAFMLAAEQDGLHAFREFLAQGIPVNTPGDRDFFNGITPFMSTAVRSDVKNMEAMVKLGANPRLRDRRGHDALFWARQFDRAENAAWLERWLSGN